MPVASARPDQSPKEMARQSGTGGPWPTGARWRVLLGARRCAMCGRWRWGFIFFFKYKTTAQKRERKGPSHQCPALQTGRPKGRPPSQRQSTSVAPKAKRPLVVFVAVVVVVGWLRGRRTTDPRTVRHKCGTSAEPVRHQCGTSAAPVRHQCGTSSSATPVRHQCGTSAAPVRHQCGTSAAPVRRTVRIACGTPEDVRRGVFWQKRPPPLKTQNHPQ